MDWTNAWMPRDPMVSMEFLSLGRPHIKIIEILSGRQKWKLINCNEGSKKW